MERGHPVSQRAQHAQTVRGELPSKVFRAVRSGGQDVRAPLMRLLLARKPAGLSVRRILAYYSHPERSQNKLTNEKIKPSS